MQTRITVIFWINWADTLRLLIALPVCFTDMRIHQDEKVSPVLEEAHQIAPNRADVAFHLLMYVDADRFAELIRGLSDDCSRALIVEGYAKELYELSLIEDEDEYFETYYLALLDFLCKYDPEGEYCDAVKKMMLSAYQFGDVYVDDAVTLKDPEKAKAFAKKYGMELLSEPFEYKC